MLRRCLAHVGDLADHIELDFAGQGAQNLRGLPCLQVGQNQGNRLRLLVLNDVEQLSRVHLSCEIEWPDLQRRGQLADELASPLLADRMVQDISREVDPAFDDVILSQARLTEFLQNLALRLSVYLAHIRNLQRQLLDFIIRKALQNLGRAVPSQSKKQDGRFLAR